MPRMTFIDAAGVRHEVDAPNGLSLLEISDRNDIGIEGADAHAGAICDGVGQFRVIENPLNALPKRSLISRLDKKTIPSVLENLADPTDV